MMKETLQEAAGFSFSEYQKKFPYMRQSVSVSL
jgi:hypothetical protein